MNMDIKTIGNKITEARKKLNISQAKLAEGLFISAQAVGKWERGESIPDIITMTRLAQILGVDLNYFSDNFPSVSIAAKTEDTTAKQESEHKNKLSWNMSRGNWVDADFSGLKNLNEKFSSSNMQNCLFIGSEISGLMLKTNHIEKCDFSGSDLSKSSFGSSSLSNNVFKDCSLKDAQFSTSHVKNCDFTGADFTGTVFKYGAFVKNIISNAIWNRSSFNGMQLDNIVFDSRIEDCYFEGCEFSKVTFQNIMLINTFFKCKSLKKIRFIDCQADSLTYAFLKNGKADLTGVSLIKS